MRILNSGRSKRQQELVRLRDAFFAGEVDAVRKRVARLAVTSLTRPERLQLAYLANVTGISLVAITLLHRLIRAKRSRQITASDEEKVEYASALVAIGAYREALGLYAAVDLERLPRAMVSLSFIYFKLSERDKMIPLLERALGNPDLETYERLRGKIRLGNALVAPSSSGLDLDRATVLLDSVVAEANTDDTRYLRWLALFVGAQAYYHQARWQDALLRLDQMEELYGSRSPAHGVYVEYWRALIDVSRTRGSRESIARIEAFKVLALSSRETADLARMADFFRAVALRDRELATYVYFGTPVEGLRKELLDALKLSDGALPEHLEYPLSGAASGGKDKEPILLDVLNGSGNLGAVALKPGQVHQRLLCALVKDFYLSPNNYALFHHLYPDEFFNPESSPVKVRQALKRLRAWIKQARLPLEVVESRGVYQLRSTSKRPFVLRISRALVEDVAADPAAVRRSESLRALRAAYGDQAFGAADVERALKVSRSSVLTLMRECVSDGSAVIEGRGPTQKYRLVG